MTTLKPAAFAPLANAYNRSGVRWAETMRFSQATPSAPSVSAAWRMVSQSDWLPMMMATGAGISLILLKESKNLRPDYRIGPLFGKLARDRQWTILSWYEQASSLGAEVAAGVNASGENTGFGTGFVRGSGNGDEEEIRGQDIARGETPKGRRGWQGPCAPRRFGNAARGGEG